MSKKIKTSCLGFLNEDLIYEILKFSDMMDICHNLCMVSKSWDFVTQQPHFWKKMFSLHLSNYNGSTQTEFKSTWTMRYQMNQEWTRIETELSKIIGIDNHLNPPVADFTNLKIQFPNLSNEIIAFLERHNGVWEKLIITERDRINPNCEWWPYLLINCPIYNWINFDEICRQNYVRSDCKRIKFLEEVESTPEEASKTVYQCGNWLFTDLDICVNMKTGKFYYYSNGSMQIRECFGSLLEWMKKSRVGK